MKDIRSLHKIIKNTEYSTKIELYFGSKSKGVDYDPRRKNYTVSYLNPVIIKGYVRDLSFQSLRWKSYGLDKVGSKEIICDSRYKTKFEYCLKIKINDEEYATYRTGAGRCLIQSLPGNLIKVIVEKK